MRAGLIVTGVLGLGTAAVFALAAVAATAFPQGSTVSAMWNGVNGMGGGGMVIAKPMPAPGVVWGNSMSGGPVVVTTQDAVGGVAAPADAAPAK